MFTLNLQLNLRLPTTKVKRKPRLLNLHLVLLLTVVPRLGLVNNFFFFSRMMTQPTLVPPVIDPSRTRIQEAVAHAPFNIFNIVAIVLIVVIGFYLYKRFIEKKPQRRFPMMPMPVQVKTSVAQAAPAPEPEVEDEVPEPPEDTTEKDD